MVKEYEIRCLEILSNILKQEFGSNYFCLSGYKEEAVCLEEKHGGWEVFSAERNHRFDTMQFDNVVEASLYLIHRVCPGKEKSVQLKNAFINQIMQAKTA